MPLPRRAAKDAAISALYDTAAKLPLNEEPKVISKVANKKNKLTGTAEERMSSVFYSPQGFWRGLAAIEKLADAASVSVKNSRLWLAKQAMWQVFLPAPKYIPRPHFDVQTPNAVHQADLLYLPHDKVGRLTFKYALTVVDVASRYKEAAPLATKTAAEVADSLTRIYERGPLKWPALLQVDPGREFMGVVSTLLASHKTKVRRGHVNIHRDQGIVERWNRTLAEKLFDYQTAEELVDSSQRSKKWVLRLPDVVAASNDDVTRLTGKKPSKAIYELDVTSAAAAPAPKGRLVGMEEERLPSNVSLRYLYQPGELEGGKRRATDPIWSVTVHRLSRSAFSSGVPVLYYLDSSDSDTPNTPERGFVREELQVVPGDTQLPPS